MRKLSFLCVVMMTTALAACDRKPKSEAPAASGWQMSSNKVTWAPIVLPSTDWDNEVMWEVHQDTGGSGFHVEMDVGR